MKQLFFLSIISVTFFFCSKKSHSDFDLAAQNEENIAPKLVSKILFSRRGANNQGFSIYMFDPDGVNEKLLIPLQSGMGEYNPNISPDGKTILFNTYRYGGWKLASFDMETQTITRITMASDYFYNGVFSPDGKKIVYEKDDRNSNHIYVADQNGQNEVNISTIMGNAENRLPVWTVDGESVVFYSDKMGNNDIYLINIQNGDVKNLTLNEEGNDFAPSISSDGQQIAFYSDRNGYLDLYVMDINGDNQINLTQDLQSINNEYNYYKDANTFWIFKSSWSPDNKRLVFSNIMDDNVELFTIQKDGTDLSKITNSEMSEYTPVWGMILE